MFAPDFLARTSDFPFLWGIDLDQRSSNIHVHLNVLESLWKHRCLDLIHRVSALVDLKWDLNCISRSPDDICAVSTGIATWEPLNAKSLSASGNSSASIMSETFPLPELNVEITKISYGIFYSNKILKLVSLGLICVLHLIVISTKLSHTCTPINIFTHFLGSTFDKWHYVREKSCFLCF